MMNHPILGLRLSGPVESSVAGFASAQGAAGLLEDHGLDVRLRAVDLALRSAGAEPGDGDVDLRVTQLDPDPEGMVVRVEVRLVQGQEVKEDGTLTFHASQGHAADLDDRLRVASPEWGRLVASHLEGMSDFATAAAHYDGTIGWAAPGRQVHFRIYKGRIIDVTRRALKGADFTVKASGGTWLDLITADKNEFMDRAMEGEFSTDGDGYEYLRTTKLLVLITDAARAVAQEVF